MQIQAIGSDGTGIAFVHGNVDKRGRLLAFGTASGGPTNDNSIRAFDGTAWAMLWPNDYTNGGCQQRHNGSVLYVPALDELWIWGGSHLETLPGALRSGRFSLATNTYLATSTDDNGAFTGVVAGGMHHWGNEALAWSEQLNAGLLFGGSGNGIYDSCFLIEPNPAGPEPYKLTEFTGPRPPARAQAHNLMVSVGADFYLVGGYAGSVDNAWTFVTDLWRFRDGTWTQLSAPPLVGYQSMLATDGARLLYWVNGTIYVYDIASDKWDSGTPAPLDFSNGVCGYLPLTKQFVFEGGNRNPDGGSNYAAFAVTLDAIPTSIQFVLFPPAIPPDPPVVAGPGGKHFTLAEDSDTGRIYFIGGDDSRRILNEQGQIIGGDGSFVNGLWSVDPSANEWRNDYPYCGNPGEIMPGRPDEVGWIYRPVDKKFYVFPGFFGLAQSGPGICGNSGATQVIAILAFDPAMRKWSDAGIPGEPIPAGTGFGRNGVYDPVTDSVIRVHYDGGMGIVWTQWSFRTRTWDSFQTPVASDGTPINDMRLGAEQSAIDPIGRHVYIMDPVGLRPMRLNIDTRQIDIMATIPDLPHPPQLRDITVLSWDTKNKVLIYPFNVNLHAVETTLLIFDPTKNSWSIGPTCRGACICYSVVHDCHLIISGLSADGNMDPSLTGYYIYRPGGTVSPPQPDPGPIPPPSSQYLPDGFFDWCASDGACGGWAYDRDTSTQSIEIEIREGATVLGRIITNIPRPDVNTYLGITGDHGWTFTLPASLFDGAPHIISAYGVDKQTGALAELQTSPKTFVGDVIPPPQGGTVDVSCPLTYADKTVTGNVTVAKYHISLLNSAGAEVQGKDVALNTASVTFASVAVGTGYKVRGQTLDAAGAVLDESLSAAFDVVAQNSTIKVVVVGTPAVG